MWSGGDSAPTFIVQATSELICDGFPASPTKRSNGLTRQFRRRGVRAIVAAMRLGKECRELRRENSRCLQETITCADEVNLLGALNRSLREALKGDYSKR